MNTHPNILAAEHSLLVIVDIQAKLTAAMPAAETMLANAGKLITAAGLLNIPVLVTEQYPQGLGSTEASLSEKLPEHTPVFEKTGFSCCAAEGFIAALKNTKRHQIILTGQETHVCVLQTALELLHRGYQIYVVEDAVCSRQSGHKSNALQRMQTLGVTVCNYESVLFEWLRHSRHAQFKAISALVR